MEYINSTASRKLTPAENMRALERAVLEADIRIQVRKARYADARFTLVMLVGFPVSTYFLYHLAAPYGVMMNHKASSGGYMGFIQNFMSRPKTVTEQYRPEIALKQNASYLNDYSRRIERQRKEGSLTEGLHHPKSWL